MYVQVRCPTPTPHGVCNRWQFELDAPPGVQMRFKCKHCRETTVLWSSQLSIPVGLR